MSAQECTRRSVSHNDDTCFAVPDKLCYPTADIITRWQTPCWCSHQCTFTTGDQPRLSWVQLGCREIMRNGLGVQAEEYSRVRDNTAFITSGHPVFGGRPPASLFRAWAAEPSSGARSGTRRQVFRSCGIDLFMSFYLAKQIEYPESDAPQQNTSCRIGYCSRWHLHLAICRFLVIYQTPVVR